MLTYVIAGLGLVSLASAAGLFGYGVFTLARGRQSGERRNSKAE